MGVGDALFQIVSDGKAPAVKATVGLLDGQQPDHHLR